MPPRAILAALAAGLLAVAPLAAEPVPGEELLAKGREALAAQRYDEAAELLSSAATALASHASLRAEAYLQLGIAQLVGLGRPSDALVAFLRSAEIAPLPATPYLWAAQAADRLGLDSEAQRYGQLAVTSPPPAPPPATPAPNPTSTSPPEPVPAPAAPSSGATAEASPAGPSDEPPAPSPAADPVEEFFRGRSEGPTPPEESGEEEDSSRSEAGSPPPEEEAAPDGRGPVDRFFASRAPKTEEGEGGRAEPAEGDGEAKATTTEEPPAEPLSPSELVLEFFRGKNSSADGQEDTGSDQETPPEDIGEDGQPPT